MINDELMTWVVMLSRIRREQRANVNSSSRESGAWLGRIMRALVMHSSRSSRRAARLSLALCRMRPRASHSGTFAPRIECADCAEHITFSPGQAA